jgi:hypothetical protein
MVVDAVEQRIRDALLVLRGGTQRGLPFNLGAVSTCCA